MPISIPPTARSSDAPAELVRPMPTAPAVACVKAIIATPCAIGTMASARTAAIVSARGPVVHIDPLVSTPEAEYSRDSQGL